MNQTHRTRVDDLATAELSVSSDVVRSGGRWQPVLRGQRYDVQISPVQGAIELVANVPLLNTRITFSYTAQKVLGGHRTWLRCPWCASQKHSLYWESIGGAGRLACRNCLGLRYRSQESSPAQRQRAETQQLQAEVRHLIDTMPDEKIPEAIDLLQRFVPSKRSKSTPPPVSPLAVSWRSLGGVRMQRRGLRRVPLQHCVCACGAHRWFTEKELRQSPPVPCHAAVHQAPASSHANPTNQGRINSMNATIIQPLRAPCAACQCVSGNFTPKGLNMEVTCLSCGAHCYLEPLSPAQKTPPAGSNKRKPKGAEIDLIYHLQLDYDAGRLKHGTFNKSIVEQYRRDGGLTQKQWSTLANHYAIPAPATAPVAPPAGLHLLPATLEYEFTSTTAAHRALMISGGALRALLNGTLYGVQVARVKDTLEMACGPLYMKEIVKLEHISQYDGVRSWLHCPRCDSRKSSLFLALRSGRGQVTCKVCLEKQDASPKPTLQALAKTFLDKLPSSKKHAPNTMVIADLPVALDHLGALLSGGIPARELAAAAQSRMPSGSIAPPIKQSPAAPPQEVKAAKVPVAPPAMMPAEKKEEVMSTSQGTESPKTMTGTGDPRIHRYLVNKSGVWKPFLGDRTVKVTIESKDGMAALTCADPSMNEVIAFSPSVSAGERDWVQCPECSINRVFLLLLERGDKGFLRCAACKVKMNAVATKASPATPAAIVAGTVVAADSGSPNPFPLGAATAAPVAPANFVGSSGSPDFLGEANAATRFWASPAPKENSNMTNEHVLVTPTMAAEFLKRNRGNRPISRRRVKAFAKLISSGAFGHTHQGMALDEVGDLLDGQHRLAAILETGISVWMVVARNVPRATFTQIDAGGTRSGGQTLAAMQVTNYSAKSSMIRIAILLEESGLNLAGTPSNEEIKAYLQANANAVNDVYAAKVKSTPMAIYGAFLYAYQCFPAKMQEFLTPFKTGAGLTTTSPLLKFRNYVTTRPKSELGHNQRKDVAITLGAIQSFIKGEKAGKAVKMDPIETLAFFQTAGSAAKSAPQKPPTPPPAKPPTKA